MSLGHTGKNFSKISQVDHHQDFSKAMNGQPQSGIPSGAPGSCGADLKAKLPYNVNQFSLTAAEVALENIERFQPALKLC
jgi:hypothetical protein